jgi:hypothetical protein
MELIRRLVVSLVLLEGYRYGVTEFNLYYRSPLRMLMLIFNIATKVIPQLIMAYNYTMLYIIWMLVTDKELQRYVEYFSKQININKNK